jgi:hypothetical protein
MKFKLYEEFLNEALERNLERATDLAILYTLKQLLPNGGNSMYGEQIAWKNIDPIFSGDGPDLFINFDESDDREFSVEFNTLYNAMRQDAVYDEIDNRFQEYGLVIEDLTPNENIVYLAFPQLKQKTTPGTPDSLTPEDLEFIVDFYKTREQKIKNLETKYRLTIIGKKYGI